MASTNIVNGAPMTIALGTQDLSIRPLAIEPEQIPTHLPKVYIYAKKGPSTDQLVVGNSRTQMYGADSFDMRSKFANHATALSNIVNAQGNAQMIQRVIPTDAGPKANFLLSLDVLSGPVVSYQRNPDGTILRDTLTGLPVPAIPAATLVGFKAKWVVTSVTTMAPGDTDADLFGVATIGVGDQTGPGPTQSVRYPIMEFWANSEGSYGNDSGFRFWAPTVNSSNPVNSKFLESNKAYPFRMSAISRLTSSSTATITETESGALNFDFTLKPNQINPVTDAQFSLGDIFLAQYQSTNDPRFAPKYADLSGFHIYQNSIDTILGLVYAQERTHVGAGSDFTAGALDEMYKLNLFLGVASSGAEYFTYQVDTAALGAVRLTEGTNIYAKGGNDGTMSTNAFAALVSSAVTQYANVNSPLQNEAVQVESIIYDSGFPLATKFDLISFIAERKDTAVVLATYEVDGTPLTAAEDHSVAVALRTRLQNFPESEYFGTSVMRGVIVGRSAKLLNSQYTGNLPLTLELAHKAAKFMGASSGKWDAAESFDRAPGNIVSLFEKPLVSWTPAIQRNKDWDIGLNYVMNYSRSQLFFPAIKTVYDNDTSVLNSFVTMMACVELQKIGNRVHREFTGSVSLTDGQLIEKVNKSVETRVLGKFANLYQIVPSAFMSDGDIARGYSWTLPISIYANGMKTVSTLYVQARRMADFTAAA